MDKRQKTRYSATLPAQIDIGAGVVRDISASGVFLETDLDLQVGSRLQLSIDIDTAGGKLRMECEAAVTRIERADGKHGVGARILSSKLNAID